MMNIENETMTTPAQLPTPQQVAVLYATGKTLGEVAIELNVTYNQVRKLIKASDTPVRSASDRLKGRKYKKRA